MVVMAENEVTLRRPNTQFSVAAGYLASVVFARDLLAGLVASVIVVANIVSFGALMFPGDLGAGMPIAIWAMLIGSCVSGLWIAWLTTLPPLATGIDSPTAAV